MVVSENENNFGEFSKCMQNVGKRLGMAFSAPVVIKVPFRQDRDVPKMIEASLRPPNKDGATPAEKVGTQFVMLLFDSRSLRDLYRHFKQLLCVRYPVPSQVI